MHPLLERQLKRYLHGNPIPADMADFVNSVDQAYVNFDKDRVLVTHSLEVMSAELTTRNDELRAELVEKLDVEEELRKANRYLQEVNAKLETAQTQLLQADKMASIGQLAAGVAHEINNPIGYVNSNLTSLENYLHSLFQLIERYEAATKASGADIIAAMQRHRGELDYDFVRQDLEALLAESREGITRVKQIVQDLKDFSRIDSGENFELADLHKGLDSTLNIVHNEVKYKAQVVKEYGSLPHIECLLSQLNQVFMNMLVNASHAISNVGTIWIRTRHADQEVCVEFEDNGCGIDPTNVSRIFDPFFTTKDVGKGTGLGLALSYGIVQKHRGRIEVDSTVGVGTRFRIWLPVKQANTP